MAKKNILSTKKAQLSSKLVYLIALLALLALLFIALTKMRQSLV